MTTTTVVRERLASVEQQPNIIIKRSCKHCNHLNICAIFRAFKPLMDNWDEQFKPINPEDLANICKEWKEVIL